MIFDLLVTAASFLLLALVQRLLLKEAAAATRYVSYSMIGLSAVLWFYYVHFKPESRPAGWLIEILSAISPIQ